MSRASFGLGLLLIACGGSATPKAEAPESTPPASKADDGAASSGDADGDAKSADAKSSSGDSAGSSDAKSDDSSKGGGASTDELKAVMQLAIEDPELDKYLHLDEAGRFPLKIAGKDVPSGLGLTKAGQPVKILDGEPAKKDAALVITKIEISGPEATIGYRFDIEGIVGTAHMKKASYGWELKSSRIVEHYRADDAGEKKKK